MVPLYSGNNSDTRGQSASMCWHACPGLWYNAIVRGLIGQEPTPGRPGRAVAQRTAQFPATPPAGYEPAALDDTIRSYVAAVEKSIRTADALSKRVEEAVTDLIKQITGTPEEKAELLTKLHERMSKAALNLVKSTDELTRLRSFLAGGPDSRPDLTVRGEVELRSLLLVAVQQLGWRVMDANGKAIEVAA